MITEEGNQFIIKYKDQCEVLIKKYNKKDLSDEEKLLEYLQAMKDNGSKIIPYNSPLLFSDKTQIGFYWNTNKDKIYNMITAEGNQFIIKYKEQCEVLIKEYNKKQLSDKEKLYEYLQAMRENGNKIIPKSSSLLFSDGTQMGYYCIKCKDKIYKMITEENQFIVKYKEQCEVLIKEYNTHQEKQKTKITEEEKLLEYLQAVKENDDKIIPRSSPLLFSDGTQISSYWKCNKDKIYNMITEEGNLFIVQYKDQCAVLINEYDKKQLSDEEKLLEYLKAMQTNDNKIIPSKSSLLFSDRTQMRSYWSDKKNRIYKIITEEDNPFIIKYKGQCEVLISEYIKFQEKPETKMTEKEKLFEYLQEMKENDNKIIPKRSSLLFSDGTKMAYYWSDKKDKIYQLVTEEDNPFIAQYKEQCELLINEYIEFQERKKKKQEKYKESESDFREESSFDKTLKNEKGKYSNEGKKIL